MISKLIHGVLFGAPLFFANNLQLIKESPVPVAQLDDTRTRTGFNVRSGSFQWEQQQCRHSSNPSQLRERERESSLLTYSLKPVARSTLSKEPVEAASTVVGS